MLKPVLSRSRASQSAKVRFHRPFFYLRIMFSYDQCHHQDVRNLHQLCWLESKRTESKPVLDPVEAAKF